MTREVYYSKQMFGQRSSFIYIDEGQIIVIRFDSNAGLFIIY